MVAAEMGVSQRKQYRDRSGLWRQHTNDNRQGAFHIAAVYITCGGGGGAASGPVTGNQHDRFIGAGATTCPQALCGLCW